MKTIQKISDTEMELMEAIWKHGHPVTSSELLHTFAQKGKDWKPQTISTFLSRLVEKKILLVTKQGRSNSYLPRVSKKEYKLWETQIVLDEMYHGSVKNMITALYDGDKLSEEDIAELKQWFSER